MRRFLVVSTLIWALIGPAAALADTAIDFTGGSNGLNDGNQTYGYSFAVSGPGVTVNALGVWDSTSMPLSQSHAVGIWDSSGNLLATTTVTPMDTAVASSDSTGQWLSASISPLTLAPGTYFAGVYYNVDTENILVSATPVNSADVTYLSAQYDFGSSLAFPESAWPSTLVGPALFTTAVSATPEPGSLVLLGSGLLGLVAARRRLR